MYLYLEIGPLKSSVRLNDVIGVGYNPMQTMTLEEEEIWTQTGTEGRECEDWEKPARHEKKQILLTPYIWTSSKL